jgi:hypothetical protein
MIVATYNFCYLWNGGNSMSNKEHYIDGMEGCSDGGCLFAHKAPGTMVTNGGCSCMRELQRTEEGFKAVRTIIHLRRELMGLNEWAKEKPKCDSRLYDYSCEKGNGCVCGGDTQGVRQGCGWYAGKQL